MFPVSWLVWVISTSSCSLKYQRLALKPGSPVAHCRSPGLGGLEPALQTVGEGVPSNLPPYLGVQFWTAGGVSPVNAHTGAAKERARMKWERNPQGWSWGSPPSLLSPRWAAVSTFCSSFKSNFSLLPSHPRSSVDRS